LPVSGWRLRLVIIYVMERPSSFTHPLSMISAHETHLNSCNEHRHNQIHKKVLDFWEQLFLGLKSTSDHFDMTKKVSLIHKLHHPTSSRVGEVLFAYQENNHFILFYFMSILFSMILIIYFTYLWNLWKLFFFITCLYGKFQKKKKR
jgi:hypothetical protein